jgi:undecaprenyl diphosphate synthase
VRQIVDDYAQGKVERNDITESYFASKLDTAQWPDPELFIRTSDEMRISNYLLWQLSYTEIYVCPVLWPDFQPQDLYDAIKTYQTRNRRLGT